VAIKWRLLVLRLSGAPSRVRVGAWRELRRLGAVSVGQSTWAVPAASAFSEGVQKVVELAALSAGECLVFDVTPTDERSADRVAGLYREAREAEWTEFLVECDRFSAEIAKEIAKAKFTSAELDEEEQSLERLRRWYRDIRLRDVLGSASAAEAERRLKLCGSELDDYADRVYTALQA
jgi:DNA-binding transcriptional regulator PaaX